LREQGMQSTRGKTGRIGSDHALSIIPRNRSRIGIHGVEEELHLGLPAALQVAGEVVWDDDSSLHGSVRDGFAHLLRVEIGARQTKTSALVELCDQLTTLRGCMRRVSQVPTDATSG